MGFCIFSVVGYFIGVNIEVFRFYRLDGYEVGDDIGWGIVSGEGDLIILYNLFFFVKLFYFF